MTAESKQSNENTEKISVLRRAIPQIIAVSVKNVLLLGFGLTLGFPTILIPSLSGGDSDEDIVLGQEEISWIGSVNYLFVPLGCLLSGIVTQPLGRRRAMQIVNLPFLAAWLLFHFATKPWHVFLALSMTGFSGGLLEAPVLTYVAEITEPHLRGTLGCTSTMSVNAGILISFFLGTFISWRTIALVNSCVPCIGLILLLFVPESPYWLISKKKTDEARRSLAWLRGWTTVDRVDNEYQELCHSLEKSHMQKHVGSTLACMDTLKSYMKPSFLKPYGLICFMFAIGHFGNTPVSIYAIEIFNLCKVPISSYYATVTIGALQLLAIIFCVGFIKCLGKRVLAWLSLTGIIACFLISGIYSYKIGAKHFNDDDDDDNIESSQNFENWILLITLVGQAFFSYLGIAALPWIMMGELFDNDVRAFASGFSSASGYVFGFIANKTFLSFVSAATLPGVFWFYAGVATVGIILLYFMLLETEGKDLQQIMDHYAGEIKLDNKVYRKKKRSGDVNKAFDSEEK